MGNEFSLENKSVQIELQQLKMEMRKKTADNDDGRQPTQECIEPLLRCDKGGHMLRPPVKMLRCGHNFCQQCLLAVQEKQTVWNVDGTIVRCPECTQLTNVPDGCVTNLPTNRALQKFLQVVGDETEQNDSESSSGSGMTPPSYTVSSETDTTEAWAETESKIVKRSTVDVSVQCDMKSDGGDNGRQECNSQRRPRGKQNTRIFRRRR